MNTELLQAKAISLSLTVKDIQTSLKWYTEVIGFTVERKIERDGKLLGYMMTAGNARVSINEDNGAKGWDRVKGQGFSFYLTTEQNVDDIAQRVKKLTGKLDSEPADMPWGVRALRLEDPDGFKFSISMPLKR